MIVFLASSAGVVLNAVVAARGVTGVHWPETLTNALDTGAASAAAGLLLLVSTSLTRQYGVGSRGRHAAETSLTVVDP